MSDTKQGTFELGDVGEYTPKLVEENDYLNKRLESDKYGIYYSVVFEGDAETYLIQAHKAPSVGQPEWGKIEKSKSGKSLRFTRVQKEGGSYSKGKAESFDKKDAYLKDVSNTPIVMYNGSLNYATQAGLNLIGDKKDFEDYVKYVKRATEAVLGMVDEVRGTSPEQTTIVDKLSLKEKFEEVKKAKLPDWADDLPPVDSYGDEDGS